MLDRLFRPLSRFLLRRRQSKCPHDMGILQWHDPTHQHYKACRKCGFIVSGMYRDGRIVPCESDAFMRLPNGRTVREEILEGMRETARIKGGGAT